MKRTIEEIVKLEVLDKLQEAADYRFLRKTLIVSGIASIFFGIIAIFLGISEYKINILNLFLVLLGVFLVFEGTWIIIKPRPNGFKLFGLALILLGSWNVLILIEYLIARIHFPSPALLFLGFLQIIWGIQSFYHYKRFSKIPFNIPSPSFLLQINEIIKAIDQAKKDPNQILIQCKSTFFFRKMIWTGFLGNNGLMVFLNRSGNDCIISRKKDIEYEYLGKNILSSYSKIQINFKNRIIKWSFKKCAYRYLNEWFQKNN